MRYEMVPKIVAYSFEVAVYDISGVKVTEPFSDAAQLVTGLYVGQFQQKEHPRVCVYPHRNAF